MASKTIFILLFNFLSSQLLHFSEAETWVKAGYWYAYGEFPVQDIDSALFTHLLCAFAEVNPSTYQLFIPSASEQDFSTFTSIVKRKNPSVKTLLSVWNGISETGKSITGEKVNDSVLSSMISESSKRKSFIDSSMKTARRYEEMALRGIPSPRITTTAAENFPRGGPYLQVFRFANIKAATNNFSSANKLGEGGFGPIYKGTLPGGQEIAVKRLSASSSQGLEEFQNEVTLTARLQHVNLVRVLGYCTEKEKKMLIYKYMPNKSLDLYLFDPMRRNMLDWEKRVHIIDGVTQGLLYLQEYANITVIHRDLKASNILLDDVMNPKISDFGMARLFRKDAYEANTDRIVGTYGYVPPEFVTKDIYTMKYDVYSFGVLLLQIISGKRNTCYYGPHENLNLLEYAYDLWNDERGTEFIDPSLDDSSSPCKIMRCMQIALLCVQENSGDRPSMLEVFTMLKNDSMAASSHKRPAFSVKADKNTGSTSASQQEICSFNDPQISELEPQ
ncbi:Cysteine-rich RLK 34 [Theobroma cacao]|uniref:non-specific serine/threonine protein kinase n=1 Tax=Theobroma cacao TaxID=3641 RepID=A0A061GJA5_THECC|nr:Cysteine-rich RLK 34 [Theobroma cacao]